MIPSTPLNSGRILTRLAPALCASSRLKVGQIRGDSWETEPWSGVEAFVWCGVELREGVDVCLVTDG